MLDRAAGPSVSGLVAHYRSTAAEQRDYAEQARCRSDKETAYAAECECRAAEFEAFADRVATLELNQD